jgi:phage tail protein X
MAKTVTSVEGDMLDAMVFRACGRTAGALEIVLDANPAVARQPLVLPAGVTVTIPDAAQQLPQRAVFKLWE